MQPAIFDLDFTQDNDYSVQITFVDADDTPIDMSAQTFTGKSKEAADSSVSYTWVVVDTDSATGIVVFSLPFATTATMPDVCLYEFRMLDTELVTFQAGVVRIRRSLFT